MPTMVIKSQDGFEYPSEPGGQTAEFITAINMSGLRLAIFKNSIGFPKGFDFQHFSKVIDQPAGDKPTLRKYIESTLAPYLPASHYDPLPE